jgi:hypothetical protein
MLGHEICWKARLYFNTCAVCITTVCLCNLHCYMFRHFNVTIRQFTTNTLLGYTRSSDCSCWKCLLTYSLTYLLTPYSTVLLEKLTGLQLVKKYPAFYGTRRFITAFTNARQLSLSWARSTQSITPHSTSWRSALILSSHLRLGLLSSLFPSGFPTKTLYTSLPTPICATRFAHPIPYFLLL